MNSKEALLQSKIVQFLQSIGVFFFSCPNEAKRSPALASRMKALGMRSGVADLVALLPGGKAVFLEVKTDSGKQSDMQKLFQQRVESLGFSYYVVRSIEDVRKTMVICHEDGRSATL
jgi:hypothetical protein